MAIIRNPPRVAAAFESDDEQTLSFLRACLSGDREAAERFISLIIRRGSGSQSRRANLGERVAMARR
jgi:hypothetical protein